MVFQRFILSASPLPPRPLSLLSLKRQSKAIITTSTSAKPQLFWCGRDCGEPLLISLSLCRGTTIRPDSARCNEGLGIKAAVERSAPLWSHCGWSPLFRELGTGSMTSLHQSTAGKFFVSLLAGLAFVATCGIELWPSCHGVWGSRSCLWLWLNDTGNGFESSRALSHLLDSYRLIHKNWKGFCGRVDLICCP